MSHMSQSLSLGMRQEQRLTPQLIQSMNILQLPLMALESKIREEMEKNPALEDGTEAAEAPAAVDAAAGQELGEAPVAQPEEAEAFSRLERLSREYDFDESDQGFGRARAADGERDAKMDAM